MFTELTSLRNRAEKYFQKLQEEVTSALEVVDGVAKFREDSWERPGGGGGRSRVLENGNIFEKAGVNFSSVNGNAPHYLRKDSGHDLTFYASGTSLVLHPKNPHIPTIHANFRYFQLSTGEAWFGGGIDLTPYYLVETDVRDFHTKLKTAADRHDTSYYPRFKKWCDEYFYINHRKESRGVGGIFFDNLGGTDVELNNYFEFVQEVGNTFLPCYLPLVEANKHRLFTEAERHWQLLRRGRYVEFNLVYDKGTVFGLETGGRIESILMSLPTLARWEYAMKPASGSAEETMINVLKEPRDWIM